MVASYKLQSDNTLVYLKNPDLLRDRDFLSAKKKGTK